MARLEIHQLDWSGEGDPIDRTTRTVRVSPGGLIEEDPVDPEWESELKSLHVIDPRSGEVVTPEDGDAWLYGLQVNYRGAYFRGVYVDE